MTKEHKMKDMLGAPVFVGDEVTWTYNEPVHCGSKPHPAIGRVTCFTEKTVMIEMLWCRSDTVAAKKVGTDVRSFANCLMVIDNLTVTRAITS